MKVNGFSKLAVIALLCSGGSLVGCTPLETRSPIHMANPFSPLSANDKSDEKKDEEEGYGTPEKIAVIWTDSVYTAPGAQPTRGFGGRFYFYDGNGEAIRVKGELAVFGFDDTTDDSQSKVPQRKFVYAPDQLQAHESMTDLGTSYSFWIPWDAVGGERKAISLIPILRTMDGRIVRGEQTINVLPGRTVEANATVSSNVSQIRQMMESQAVQAGFTESGPNTGYGVDLTGAQANGFDPYSASRQRTSTISVPREMGRSLQGPQAQRNAAPSNMNVPAQRMTVPTNGYQQPSLPAATMPSATMPSAMLPNNVAPGASMGGGYPASIPGPATYPPTGNAIDPRMGPMQGYGFPGYPNPGYSLPATMPGGNAIDPASVMPMNPNSYDPSTGTRTGMGPAPGFRSSSAHDGTFYR